ncbi:MAG TPA: hypothetical protein VFI08_09015 [Spirochaetia bacterium]|nr:hypothetical protein [Spirochaetia bacterium]
MHPVLRRSCLAAALLVSLAATAGAQEFRKTSWLMNREQVIASEGASLVSETDLKGNQQQVVFQSYLGGFPVMITYLLENDALLSASYTFRRDADRSAWAAMKQDLVTKNGPPSFEQENLLGWRLPKTEIALAHLKDGTTYVAYWEKSYFARINNLPPGG